MATTHPITPEVSTPQRESLLHLLARESQLVLRVLVLISLLATVVVMATFFFWAIIPAMCLLMFYGMLLLANGLEIETRRESDVVSEDSSVAQRDAAAGAPEVVDETAEHEQRVASAVHYRLTRIGIEVLVAAAVIGVVMAGVLFGWDRVAIGALVIFAYTVFVTTPVWLGWMEKDMQEEIERQQDSAHVDAH